MFGNDSYRSVHIYFILAFFSGSLLAAPFDGKHFSNLEPFHQNSFVDVLKWQFTRYSTSVPWPEHSTCKSFKPEVARATDKVYMTAIGHATVLIQMDGVNILTDPVFSERASPFSFLGPKRACPPGILLSDLPPIDFVLVSHNHYDHLDIESLVQLYHKHRPKFYVPLGNKRLLEDEGITGVEELDWYTGVTFQTLQVTLVPAQHWSARMPWNRNQMLWGGFYIAGTKRIYFAGDTGYGNFFKTITEKLGAPDVALLPIGAYEPRWFMKHVHMNPDDAVRAMLDLKAKLGIGIHFGVFKLTDEGIEQPAIALKEALAIHHLDPARFVVPVFGQARIVD